MAILLLNKVRFGRRRERVLPKEICDVVATYLRRPLPFVLYDPRFVVIKGLTLEYLYNSHGRYIFKMVRDSLFSTQRFTNFHAHAVTPFWHNMHGDLILAVNKLDMERYSRGKYYICDVEFLIIRHRKVFLEPEYEAVIVKKRIRGEMDDF